VETARVETLIAAIATWIREKNSYLTKTKLLKLLYLFDLAYFRSHGATFTGFSWKFFHLGPWAAEYDPILEGMLAQEILTQQFSESETAFYKPTEPTELQTALPQLKDELTLRQILNQWGDKSTGEILDYVYFQTAPMETAVRNQPLDFSAIPQSSGIKYERNASGATPNEIKRLKAQFEKRRAELRSGNASTRVTPPNYDDDFEKAMAVLESLEA
jgi:hypothetical protein